MEFGKYRIKMMEAFKDGNILGGRFLKVGEVLTVDEQDLAKIRNSGGIFDLLETVIPNPKKSLVVEEILAEVEERKEEEAAAKRAEELQASEVIARPEPEKRKAGRPKKHVA